MIYLCPLLNAVLWQVFNLQLPITQSWTAQPQPPARRSRAPWPSSTVPWPSRVPWHSRALSPSTAPSPSHRLRSPSSCRDMKTGKSSPSCLCEDHGTPLCCVFVLFLAAVSHRLRGALTRHSLVIERDWHARMVCKPCPGMKNIIMSTGLASLPQTSIRMVLNTQVFLDNFIANVLLAYITTISLQFSKYGHISIWLWDSVLRPFFFFFCFLSFFCLLQFWGQEAIVITGFIYGVSLSSQFFMCNFCINLSVMEIKWQGGRNFAISCIKNCIYKKHAQAVGQCNFLWSQINSI